MPIDSFMLFQKYGGEYMNAESQVSFENSTAETEIGKIFVSDKNKGKVFEVDSFDFDVEQTINMSSQSSGAGAGKIAFNPFKVKRKIDLSTPQMFQMACQGTTFQTVLLGFRKASGVTATGLFFLRFDFKLVALKHMTWSHDEESPTEELEFEYGGLQIRYGVQQPGGAIVPENPVGWNKIKNVADIGSAII